MRHFTVQIQADVYVNTTNVNLNISSGGIISTMLLNAAGPQLQQECSKNAPINYGDVAVTGAGGTLKCRKIFHIALGAYDGPGGNAETVRRLKIQYR